MVDFKKIIYKIAIRRDGSFEIESSFNEEWFNPTYAEQLAIDIKRDFDNNYDTENDYQICECGNKFLKWDYDICPDCWSKAVGDYPLGGSG